MLESILNYLPIWIGAVFWGTIFSLMFLWGTRALFPKQSRGIFHIFVLLTSLLAALMVILLATDA